MARYIRKFSRVGQALGPSEERGFAMWVGYDIEDTDGDLSELGYVNVEGWSDEQLAEYNVVTFRAASAAELGIERRPDAEPARTEVRDDARRDQERRKRDRE